MFLSLSFNSIIIRSYNFIFVLNEIRRESPAIRSTYLHFFLIFSLFFAFSLFFGSLQLNFSKISTYFFTFLIFGRFFAF